MRRKKPIRFKSFTKEKLAEQFARQREAKKQKRLSEKFSKAIAKFRPKKSERGQIVFIGVKGDREAATKGRRGYAVYVNRNGKKMPVLQFQRDKKALEKTPVTRKLSSIDVSSVKSDKARKKFLTAYANPISAQKVKNIPASHEIKSGDRPPKVPNGTIYSGHLATSSYYVNSSSVEIMGKVLRTAINTSRGKRDFLVSIGMSCATADGRQFWISTECRISRNQHQPIKLDEAKEFFGRVIYRLLAVELANRGLVLSGSAKHVQRLKINKGKSRGKWKKPYKDSSGKKQVYLWEGHDYQDVQIEYIEWRIDRLHFK